MGGLVEHNQPTNNTERNLTGKECDQQIMKTCQKYQQITLPSHVTAESSVNDAENDQTNENMRTQSIEETIETVAKNKNKCTKNI